MVIVVCVDIVEQHVFLYESYVKCGSARNCRKKFCHKFPRITVPSTTGFRELIVQTEEKLDEIRTTLEHTPQKSSRLAQETGILNLSVAKVTKWWISTYLNGTERLCVCMYVYRDITFSISCTTGKLTLFLWSNTWLVSGKACSVWRQVMKFLLEARILELHVTMHMHCIIL
jgi:hypothetical protein